MKLKKILCLVLGCIMLAALVAAGCGSTAKDTAKKDKPQYPTKTITIVCQNAAGGATDLLARAIANSLSKRLGQSVVVDNKIGASGTIGTDYALKAKPDGYTLVTHSTGNYTSTPLMQKVPYDPIKDVRHIINITTQPIILVVPADSPWKTIEDFVAYAKQNPGKVKYGQNSPGGTTHMAMEMFRKSAGLDMKMVPFGGGAMEVIAALLGKHVEIATVQPNEVEEHIKGGKLRALISFNDKRFKSMPDLPTAKERGFNVVLAVTKGISAPAGIPDDIAKKLHDTLKEIMSDEEFKAQCKKAGMLDDLDYMSGEDVSKMYQKMTKDMDGLITELGLKKK